MTMFNINNYRYYSDCYVETGFCEGSGLQRAINAGFPRIKSCEAHKPFFDHCISRFANCEAQVSLFFGTSNPVLGSMLYGEDRCVILLDAHPAGPHTAGHQDLMEKGADSSFHQHKIITEELKIITSHRPDHLIIIDDVNGKNPESEQYMDMLPGYSFVFADEDMGIYYPEKLLVCIPTA